MNRRFALPGLSLLPVLLAQSLGADRAQGDQIFPSASARESLTSCRMGESGLSCTHFEGYVVVRRRPGATDAAQAVARPEAVLSANRLYLPTDAEKAP